MTAPDLPRPTPAAARLAGARWYARRPGLLLRKLREVPRRRRAARRLRAALDRGGLVTIVSAAPAAGLVSVLTPVHRVREDHLRAAIASVRAQTLPEWELVLLDDASPDPHVARVLAGAARDDPRVRLLHHTDNRGIATSSDALVAAARGTWAAFLDHDDLLHPRALELASRALAANPHTDWLFTDEDKIDEAGRHHSPCLKPGWSHHLLLAFNLVTHLRVVRREAVQRAGGHRAGVEGAQDYDLALRVLAGGGRFLHLPGVLYHWRAAAGSMAAGAAAKPAANAAALDALARHAAAFPAGGAVEAAVLVDPASLFRVRRLAAADLEVAVVAPRPCAPPGRAVESLVPPPGSGPVEAAVRCAARSRADVLVVPPPGGDCGAGLEELLALLQVPGTALAAGQFARGARIAASGWLAGPGGELLDPRAGRHRRDPGYLNLGLVAAPRAVPLSTGWACRREALLEAWESAADVPPVWRLAAGLARAGLETVSTPEVRWAAAPPPPPDGAAPEALRAPWPHWLRDLALLP